MKEVMYITTEKSKEINQLLKNFDFWTVFWIASSNCRFIENCKHKK